MSTDAAPKGELTLAKLWGLILMKKTVALWNYDTKDYLMSSSNEVDVWCSAYTPNRGDVVLLHDNRPFAADAVQPLAQRTADSEVTFYSLTDQTKPEGRWRKGLAPVPRKSRERSDREKKQEMFDTAVLAGDI